MVGAVTYPPEVNGAAFFGSRLATGLAARGHEVHVICHSTDSTSSVLEEDGVTVHRVPSFRTPFHPTFRAATPWQAASSADRLLDEVQPDVVHVQSHFFIGNALIKSARRRGIALVGTNHFMPENIFGYLGIPRLLQRLGAQILWRTLIKRYRKAAVVTAPTPRAVRLLQDNGFTDRALAVSCGIDVGHYQRPAREFRMRNPHPDVRTVLFVGRLDEEKHIDDLVRAMPLLSGSTPTRLEIVGEGSCREPLEQLATELGVRDRVHFAGLVSDRELLDAYARADVFCMPSIAELQSLATMEAMSAGTPVVLANAMALPHLVEPGENGFLYPPRDVAALAEAIDRIISDAATIDRMGKASERLIAKHDISAVLGRFESIYDHVMNPSESWELAEVTTELAS